MYEKFALHCLVFLLVCFTCGAEELDVGFGNDQQQPMPSSAASQGEPGKPESAIGAPPEITGSEDKPNRTSNGAASIPPLLQRNITIVHASPMTVANDAEDSADHELPGQPQSEERHQMHSRRGHMEDLDAVDRAEGREFTEQQAEDLPPSAPARRPSPRGIRTWQGATVDHDQRKPAHPGRVRGTGYMDEVRYAPDASIQFSSNDAFADYDSAGLFPRIWRFVLEAGPLYFLLSVFVMAILTQFFICDGEGQKHDANLEAPIREVLLEDGEDLVPEPLENVDE